MRVVSTPMKKRPSKRGSDRKAGFCSRRSGGKIMHVLFLWWSCWTDGATVDACSQHADEEASIEARVSSESSASADFEIQVHLPLRYPIGPKKISHFRTSIAKDRNPRLRPPVPAASPEFQ